MKIDRQNYKDCRVDEAIAAGCDVLQLKYDGWWSRVEIDSGLADVYSRNNHLITSFSFDPTVSGTFIGEYMFGTQWAQHPDRKDKFFFFDCWRVRDTPLTSFHYCDRYGILRANMRQQADRFQIVANFPIVLQKPMWKNYVLSGDYEGLVYRNKHGLIDDTLFREKNKITIDVRVIGFEEGKSGHRHEGRLGALLCCTRKGIEVAVGGGIDDKAREHIWQNPAMYLGRWCTIEGRAEFTSGSIRHPNFLHWRDDLVGV